VLYLCRGLTLCGLTNTLLKYELEKIESVIVGGMVGATEGNRGQPLDETNALIETVREETDHVKKQFIQEIFCFGDERHLERYIQFHQQQLIRLMNELATHERADQVDPLLYKVCYNAVEELLRFIEGHFTKYFDQDVKAPQSYVTLAAADVLKTVNELRDKFSVLEVRTELLDLALQPLVTFIQRSTSGQLTYRDLIYVNEIRKELLQILSKGKSRDDLGDEIRQVLLYLNYNTIRYFRYFAIYITSRLEDPNAPEGRLERLSFALKTIGQTQVKPGFAFHRALPSLKEQVLEWIHEEILHLERTQQLTDRATSNLTLAPDFKLKTEASVSQLAYLLRVFIETHFLQNKNTSDLMRFFTKFFQSKRLDNISYESFRVRYYNPEDGAKKGVRGILLKMVDYINNN
jgi:hypothetical protein